MSPQARMYIAEYRRACEDRLNFTNYKPGDDLNRTQGGGTPYYSRG